MKGLVRTFWKCPALDDEEHYEELGDRWRTSEADANLVSSECENHMHMPVLDLDFPCELVPSSTEGHYHLYMDLPMPWATYRELLRALFLAGVIEEGCYLASIERKATMVRKKGVYKKAPGG